MEPSDLKVLVGCETSGIVRQAFNALGFDAWSCDILPSDDQTNKHIQDDIRNALKMDSWDLICIMHPPCTRLCVSGARWLHELAPSAAAQGKTLEDIWNDLEEGCKLFADCWNADAPCIAVENPIMHYHAKDRIEKYSNRPFPRKANQIIHPWHFATNDNQDDNQKKQTCFWLHNLPALERTGTLDGTTARDDVHKAAPSAERWKIRSKFFPRVAEQMAAQWGLAALQQKGSVI